MKILIIPSWYPNSFTSIGGIFFKEQAEALAKYGHDVSVLSISQYSVREILKYKKIVFKNNDFIENGVATYTIEYPSIPKLHTLRDHISFYLFKRKFKKYVEKNGLPDIVHVHSFAAGKYALWLKENYNIPYVITEHFSGFARGLLSETQIQLAKEVFSHSSTNIAVSKEFQLLLENKFNLKFKYIPNIVNIDFFTPVLKSEDERFKFINIASLDENKNQKMLIQSFAKVFKDKNVRLTIVGDGPELQSLKNLIDELQMQEQITLFGRANREEVKTLLQESDAFVLSSKYETFGVVVIEAMSCGLPVIATKCGGPESIVRDKRVGLLTDIDENSLADLMKYLYENRDTYDSEYIAQYTKDKFSEEAVVAELEEVYNDIIDSYNRKKQ